MRTTLFATLLFVVMAAVVLSTTRVSQADEEKAKISLDTVPPVVVKTLSESGSDKVPAGAKQIKVTFSKDMQPGSWSWSTLGEENFPEIDGKIKYLADKRTCVLPVKLEPGKFYAIWLNSNNFGNFKDAGGRPAVPYLLVFETAP